jgi:hypothetical protein
VVGVPYWSLAYQRVSLPGALLGPGLYIVGAAAATLCASGAESFRRAILVGGAAPAAVLARVMVEVVRDPTSHNLWPLEAIIASALGFGCALAGAMAGSVVVWVVVHREGAR